MGQTSLVEGLDGSLYGSEVVAITTLVTERPHEDADVVAHPANVVLRAFYHRILEL